MNVKNSIDLDLVKKIFCFSLGLLPAGVFIKIPALYILFFLIILFSFGALLQKTNSNKINLINMLAFLSILLVIIFSYINGTVNIAMNNLSNYSLTSQFHLLLVNAIIIFSFFLFEDKKRCNYALYIIYGYTLLCFIKLICISLISFKVITIYEFQQANKYILGYIPVMQIITGSLVRVQYMNDILLLPIFSLILLNSNTLLRLDKFKTVIVLILFFSWVFTFSRFFFGAISIITFLSLFVRKISRKEKFFIFVFFILIGILFLWKYDLIYKMVETRFFSVENSGSDEIRSIQFSYLFEQIKSMPLFGAGLGYFVDGYIRSSFTPYSYELQWISLTMQLGFFGVIVYFIYFNIMAFGKIKKISIKTLFLYSSFTLVILASFTNPLLFSISMIGVLIIFNEEVCFSSD
ncbi:hypothetical protein [Photobacterium phosphoreum]|uniref:hypothetical protein n=1 Tax=Photobacterium phosphoreum TaxID=659 RepID=UPI0011B1E2E3|nr:hypothetical protein [Photobacterium phosphoreum]